MDLRAQMLGRWSPDETCNRHHCCSIVHFPTPLRQDEDSDCKMDTVRVVTYYHLLGGCTSLVSYHLLRHNRGTVERFRLKVGRNLKCVPN